MFCSLCGKLCPVALYHSLSHCSGPNPYYYVHRHTSYSILIYIFLTAIDLDQLIIALCTSAVWGPHYKTQIFSSKKDTASATRDDSADDHFQSNILETICLEKP